MAVYAIGDVQGCFDELIKLPQTDGPKLVFLHLISPHAPFIFDSDGVPITPAGFLTLEVDGHFSKSAFSLAT